MTQPIAIPDAETVRRFDRPGPRYTSYPTAVEFHDGVGETQYREKLAIADREHAGEPLSLYVHIPFCAKHCSYCGCHVIATQRRDVAAEYLEYVGRELELVAAQIPHRRRLIQLHWGGGTPTYLDPDQLGRLFGHDHEPLRAPARRRARHRGRPARHHDRAPREARRARLQPPELRRAGLHPRRAGGDRPRPDLRADERAHRERPPGRLRRGDQLRPRLRPAAADRGELPPEPRAGRRAPPGSPGDLLLRLRPLDPPEPEADRPVRAAAARGEDGALLRGARAPDGRRLRADRHGPLRAARRRARPRRARRQARPQLHGLHGQAVERHDRLRRLRHRRGRGGLLRQREEAVALLREDRRKAASRSSAATCSTRTTASASTSSAS